MKDLEALYGTTDAASWICTDETDPEAPAFLCTHFDPVATATAVVKDKHSKPFRRAIAVNMLKPSDNRLIMVRTFIEVSLKDWRNVAMKNAEGVLEMLPFTKENAERVFTKFEKLYIFVAVAAGDDDSYKLGEDEAKN